MLMSNEEYDTFHHNWMVCDKTFEVTENITEEQREKNLKEYKAIKNGDVPQIT